MIISRRQREALLDEMTRMLANKQHVAFANHAKIAERVSNGDLSFYIDSPNKEFIIKYAQNTMRFNAKEKTFSELNALIFANKNRLTGISDTVKNESTVALSSKWGYEHEKNLRTIMAKWNPSGINIGAGTVKITGITDEYKYSEQHLLTYEYWKDHEQQKDEEDEENYDERYAFKNHTHNDLVNKTEFNISLQGKSNVGHTHDGLWERDDIIDLIEETTEEPWYTKLFRGLKDIVGIAADAGEIGYIYALQNQVNALYAAMASNGLIDVVQSGADMFNGITGVVNGISSKLNLVTNVLNSISKVVPQLSDAIDAIVTPIQQVADALDNLDGLTDLFDDVTNTEDFFNRIAHHISETGSIDDLKVKLIPDTFDTISSGNINSGNILETIADIPTNIRTA